ncbi:Fic family protein [Calidithermus chliarophilus]|uniref:Fic family protein n=1 Tax=Calidithermus chliarophilus TaxID=52023 RepID=UPI001FE0791B|nr:Fic family protein [Calidithermus chliarophilus]
MLLEAQGALGQLKGTAERLPNPDLLVMMYIRAEAVLSSQIEGTQASLDDVLRAEANLANPDAPGDVQEVINYIEAMDYGLRRQEELPVSLRLIREIHGILMNGVRGSQRDPGEFRRSQNWIGPVGSTLQTARFVPPPVPEMLVALDNLERFIYEEDSRTPPLVKIGLIHAQFETIHPFLDGNGRLGRLLITLLMCHYGLLDAPLLYLSHFFKLNRSEYYDRLQAIRERGDWEGWLRFFLEGVRSVATESTQKTRDVLDLREQDRLRIGQELGRRTANALTLHEHLLRQPFVNVRRVQSLTGLSYSNANALVGELVRVGVLQPASEHARDRLFVYQRYLDIFRLERDETTGISSDESTFST